jgi:hypothetical protein
MLLCPHSKLTEPQAARASKANAQFLLYQGNKDPHKKN